MSLVLIGTLGVARLGQAGRDRSVSCYGVTDEFRDNTILTYKSSFSLFKALKPRK